MAIIDVNWNPTDRQLRQFGAICLIALPAAGWLWRAELPVVGWWALVGAILAAIGLVLPRLLLPLYWALTMVALPIGMVVGELAMLTIYFGVFLPLGLLFRIARRDALHRKFDRHRPSYWQAKEPPSQVSSYYRQS